ncbi:hypothetical protein ACVBGC_32110 [Burkholderia stagnalis]
MPEQLQLIDKKGFKCDAVRNGKIGSSFRIRRIRTAIHSMTAGFAAAGGVLVRMADRHGRAAGYRWRACAGMRRGRDAVIGVKLKNVF